MGNDNGHDLFPTDRQRLLARQIVEGTWRKRVATLADHILRNSYRGEEKSVVILTPRVSEYDEAERILMVHENQYTALARKMEEGFAGAEGPPPTAAVDPKDQSQE